MTSVPVAAPTDAAPARTWNSANSRLWAVQAVLAAGYVAAAVPKLGSDPQVIASFAELGVSAAGMHAIGVLELAGAAGLLIPRLVGASASAFVALMIGAVSLTVIQVGALEAIAPAAYLALAAVVAWCRRDRTVRLAAVIAGAVRRRR